MDSTAQIKIRDRATGGQGEYTQHSHNRVGRQKSLAEDKRQLQHAMTTAPL